MDFELELDSPRPTASSQVYDHVMELRHISPTADDVPTTAAVLAYQPPHNPFAPISDMEYMHNSPISLAEQQPIVLRVAGTAQSISSDSGSECEDPDGSLERRMGNKKAGNAGMHPVFKRSRFVLTLHRSRSTKCRRHHHRYALWLDAVV